MTATQKFSCRNLVGPSLPWLTLFCFGLVWSNQIAGKMYPEMDIRHTDYSNMVRVYFVPQKQIEFEFETTAPRTLSQRTDKLARESREPGT